MADDADENVTLRIEQLKVGDPAGARSLWDGDFARLVTLAGRPAVSGRFRGGGRGSPRSRRTASRVRWR